ncbi:MAG TPA: DUF6152 family protein [Candidatus Angelobacter sp.]|nr:DUF6152 family protein [Candidatus Angelobacter sp.]
MRTKILAVTLGAALLLIAAGAAFAHHGTAAYDTKNIVTVKGTMTEFRYINPHVQLFFDVKNDKGETEKWQAELTAPNKLSRAGWDKNTLKPGDSITASGYVSKNDPHTMWINKLIGPDGQRLRLFEE